MKTNRYSEPEIKSFVQTVVRDGLCILPNHFPHGTLRAWHEAFMPLLQSHIDREGHLLNRGPGRYYVTLPFTTPFSDPAIFEDDDVLAIIEELVGTDPVMPQLASDTPVLGSEYQEIHRDAPPLFPETGRETLPFQLAVNFPLVDITKENGPLEVTRGTHMLSRAEGLRKIALGEMVLEPLLMQLGDVIIRDVRGLHRGTPNQTEIPRPMVVIGYSRKWLFRPEVSIRVPRAALDNLSERGRRLLRFNPIVESLARVDETEVYQSFAY